LLFERGQAEYWNGFVHWKRGELPAATEWLNRYRDTGIALVALDPSQTGWQRELSYGQQNLASVHVESGDLDEARTEFLAELETLKRLLTIDTANLELTFQIAEVHSWLGELAERQGRLAEAMERYVKQTTLLDGLVKRAPDTTRWRFLLANSLLYETDISSITGQLTKADKTLKEAQKILKELVQLDPDNRQWEMSRLNARLKEAMLARAQGNLSMARRLVEEVIPIVESLSTTERSDRAFTQWLATARRMEAQIRADTGQPDAAIAALQATELGEKLMHEGKTNTAIVGEYALACVISGEIAARANETAAKLLWERASTLLTPRQAATNDWRLLDPAARASYLLGHIPEAQTIIDRLTKFGYVPLNPWPEASKIISSQPQSK
jgi:tetratricopeptide (TPR) repeat protein